jgi:hypothetical protein
MEGVDHLAFERKKAQFDVNDMKIVWAGSRQEFELSDRISRLVASDPVNSIVFLTIIFYFIFFCFISIYEKVLC